MAWVLISYDVDSAHDTAMKKGLKSKDFNDNLTCGSQGVMLPNTTLCKKGIDCATGLADMQTVASSIHAKLEKAIAVEFNACKGIAGN